MSEGPDPHDIPKPGTLNRTSKTCNGARDARCDCARCLCGGVKVRQPMMCQIVISKAKEVILMRERNAINNENANVQTFKPFT